MFLHLLLCFSNFAAIVVAVSAVGVCDATPKNGAVVAFNDEGVVATDTPAVSAAAATGGSSGGACDTGASGDPGAVASSSRPAVLTAVPGLVPLKTCLPQGTRRPIVRFQREPAAAALVLNKRQFLRMRLTHLAISKCCEKRMSQFCSVSHPVSHLTE